MIAAQVATAERAIAHWVAPMRKNGWQPERTGCKVGRRVVCRYSVPVTLLTQGAAEPQNGVLKFRVAAYKRPDGTWFVGPLDG